MSPAQRPRKLSQADVMPTFSVVRNMLFSDSCHSRARHNDESSHSYLWRERSRIRPLKNGTARRDARSCPSALGRRVRRQEPQSRHADREMRRNGDARHRINLISVCRWSDCTSCSRSPAWRSDHDCVAFRSVFDAVANCSTSRAPRTTARAPRPISFAPRATTSAISSGDRLERKAQEIGSLVCRLEHQSPTVNFEAVMQDARPADHALVHGVNLAQVTEAFHD